MAVAREVFQVELEERSLGLGAMLFSATDLTDRVEPPAYRHEVLVLSHRIDSREYYT